MTEKLLHKTLVKKQFQNNVDMITIRGVINGKAGKAAALPKFSDTLTLSQSGGADYASPLALSHLKKFLITPLRCQLKI